MIERGAYGNRIARHFRVDSARVFTVQTARSSTLAVTRIRGRPPSEVDTIRLPAEDAFIVTLQLRETAPRRRHDGSLQPTSIPKGGVTVIDLNHKPTAWIAGDVDELQFYMPRAAFDEIADRYGSAHIESLRSPDGEVDEIIVGLGDLLLPALESAVSSSSLFAEQVTLAICAHVAHTYGGLRPVARPPRSGLAPWQERRAKALLVALLEGNGSLADIACQCQLSPSHFARAFRQSTGQPPHRWLAARRVERAQSLLLHSDRTLVEIALSCGFGDQTHFTKAFRRIVGESPGAWRRACR